MIGEVSVIGSVSRHHIILMDDNQLVYENEGNGKTETMSR